MKLQSSSGRVLCAICLLVCSVSLVCTARGQDEGSRDWR
jgi:hypothetical protein